jgi:ParB family chromosome partitioning protein
MTVERGKRLGRGLEALISRAPSVSARSGEGTRASESAEVGNSDSPLKSIPIRQVRPNPLQPRKEFKPEELADLEASLRTNGLLQPITVRHAPQGGGYELIAGERRFRAAQRLGWTEIPALVKDVDDRTLLSLALVENLQRSDLNPIEEAEGYQHLISEFSLTQPEVADVVGKDRSTVANTLRLLALPASVRRLVWDGQLTIGHARALLGLGDETRMADLAREIVAQGLSVREVERLVRETGKPSAAARTAVARPDGRSAEVRRLEDRLRKHLGTDAKIVQTGKDRGEMRIPFYSADDFERVMELLVGPGQSS